MSGARKAGMLIFGLMLVATAIGVAIYASSDDGSDAGASGEASTQAGRGEAGADAIAASAPATIPAVWTYEFPREYFHGKDAVVLGNLAFIGKPPPPLILSGWMNGEIKPDDLKGKVVLIDFWATWCSDCMVAMPKTNVLAQKYKDQGLVVIGACTNDQQEKMAEVVQKLGVTYHIAADPTHATETGWKINRWPTYGMIDRTGKLRMLGVEDQYVEEIVKKLVDEPGT